MVTQLLCSSCLTLDLSRPSGGGFNNAQFLVKSREGEFDRCQRRNRVLDAGSLLVESSAHSNDEIPSEFDVGL